VASGFASALVLAALHQSAIKYVDLVVDGATVGVKVTVAPADVTEPLGLPAAAQPTAIAAATPAVASYVRGWIAIAGCPPSGERATPDLDNRFVAVTWEARCASRPDELDLDLAPFFAVDPRHEAIVRISGGEPIVIRAAHPRWEIPLGGSPRSVLWYVLPACGLGLGLAVLWLRRLRRRSGIP
jgi:hypothetical protein